MQPDKYILRVEGQYQVIAGGKPQIDRPGPLSQAVTVFWSFFESGTEPRLKDIPFDDGDGLVGTLADLRMPR